jgi:HPt (histidine-containing phosphotransfer) domain-containing protein
MDDYLAKPVTRGQLEHCLHRWLQERDTARPPAPTVASDALSAPPVPQPTATPASSAAPAHPPAVAATAAEPVLDVTALDELYAVIGPDASRIVTVFLEDAPHLLAQLERAALAPDYPALRDAAHSLKSSSANLGAMALSAAAKRVELGARMQTLDRPAVAVAIVNEEFARARSAMQARLGASRRTAEA